MHICICARADVRVCVTVSAQDKERRGWREEKENHQEEKKQSRKAQGRGGLRYSVT